MNLPDRRRGVRTLRTLGRGFWIGIVGSVALHAALLSTGSLQIPEKASPRIIEARLEIKEPPSTQPPPQEDVKTAANHLPKPAATLPTVPTEPTPAEAPPVAVPAAQSIPGTDAPYAPAEKEKSPPNNLPVDHAVPLAATQSRFAMPSDAAENLKQLPMRIETLYELQGMIGGRQTHVWHREGQQYTLGTTSEVTGLAGIFVGGKMTQKSTGRIGELGLMPERYEMQRFSGKREILVFNYPTSTIKVTRIDRKKGERTSELQLMAGTQDPLSSIYQLAMIAQGGDDGLIVTAGTKRVKGYPYRILGKEVQQTRLGELNTLHVTRVDDSGSGSVHLWLSPDKHYLPVRISYTDDDGKEWVLQAINIKVE
jgi:hypothetical protein